MMAFASQIRHDDDGIECAMNHGARATPARPRRAVRRRAAARRAAISISAMHCSTIRRRGQRARRRQAHTGLAGGRAAWA